MSDRVTTEEILNEILHELRAIRSELLQLNRPVEPVVVLDRYHVPDSGNNYRWMSPDAVTTFPHAHPYD